MNDTQEKRKMPRAKPFHSLKENEGKGRNEPSGIVLEGLIREQEQENTDEIINIVQSSRCQRRDNESKFEIRLGESENRHHGKGDKPLCTF